MKDCYIFGSAEIADYSRISKPETGDIVIAADGGLRHLVKLGWKPDFFVGDMDSLYDRIPGDVLVDRYPSEKDDTDTFIAVKKGLELSCERFVFYGCLGGNLSHTVANLQILTYLANIGKSAVLLEDQTEIYPLHNDTICFEETRKGKISIFSVSHRSEGVTLKGLKYPLKEAVISNQFPLGVSNEFIGNQSCITVKNGDLILILEKTV